ncbi:MAG: 3-hydroxyacyl-CoA dehydrogenase family protein [Planctomycetota bacterium]
MSTIQTVAVIGAGTMGQGIAQVAALGGYRTHLRDTSSEIVDRARASIRASLGKGVEKGKVTAEARDQTLDRLTTTTSLGECLRDADLVIEAIPESIDLKREMFASVSKLCKPNTLLASNTSSLSITEIAAAAKFPEWVLGLHFFNPVPVMELVEIVRGHATAEPALQLAKEFVATIGKTPIVVQDSPGFASSRLGITLGNEAMRMLETGVASAEDIDRAMELGYRHPIGPLRLSDLVGLDVRLAITEHLYRELGTDTFRPPQILRRLVRAGKLGKKSGEGFYKY